MYTIKGLDTWLGQQENEERTDASIHTEKVGSGVVCSLWRETPAMIPKYNLEPQHFHYVQHNLWVSLNLIGHLCVWVLLESRRSKLQLLVFVHTVNICTPTRWQLCQFPTWSICGRLCHCHGSEAWGPWHDCAFVNQYRFTQASSILYSQGFLSSLSMSLYSMTISPGPINNFWKIKYYSETTNIFPDQIDIKFSSFVITFLSIYQFYALKILLMYILIYSICKVVSDTFKIVLLLLLLFRKLTEIEDFLLVLDVIRVIFTKPVH